MLHLPDVTLVCADTQAPALAKLTLDDCLAAACFAEVIVASPEPIIPDARWVRVEKFPHIDDYCRWLWYALPPLLRTTHFLVVQWDGWILHPEEWQPDWMELDYIGAPWSHLDGRNVGNGGFSLRSAKLARELANHPDLYPYDPNESEDSLIGRFYRPALERAGIIFATEAEARHFSFEWTEPEHNTFGFHWMRNFARVLPPTRLAERLRLLRANPYTANKAKAWGM